MSDISALYELTENQRRILLRYKLSELKPFVGGVHIETQGRLFRVSIQGITSTIRSDGGVSGAIRGVVGAFTPRSRKRLMEKLARLDSDRGPVSFLTLTYPIEFPTPQRAKEHLRAWFKRVTAQYPAFSAVWRLELQARGAPHFHLIMFNLPFVPKEWIQSTWASVIGCPGFPVWTRIEAIRSWRGVMWYAAKYIAKESETVTAPDYAIEIPQLPDADNPSGPQGSASWVTVLTSRVPSGLDSLPYLAVTFDHVGRWWGIHNEVGLPYAVKEQERLEYGPWVYRIKRSVEHVWADINTRTGQGFTLFCDNPKQWLEYARIEAGTSPPPLLNWHTLPC